MRLFQLLLYLTFLFVSQQEFNVYYTYNDGNRGGNHQYARDCLLHIVEDDNIKYNKIKGLKSHHETILYCFRFINAFEYEELNISNTSNEKFKFSKLKILNITSHDLYLWSAPIDLIEDYEIFLQTNNTSSSEMIFHNCSFPWFGSLCQYVVHRYETTETFADVIKRNFMQSLREKYIQIIPEILTNLSCYVHLRCNRGGSFPACLDWREICDGKIDCIDGGFDERDCIQLEINECNDNEYRCHYGQCIPEDFWQDDILNPECLDGTDESVHDLYPDLCPYDISFRCENIRCRSFDRYALNCGDGQCKFGKCDNKRDLILIRMLVETTVHISNICRTAIMCLAMNEDCKMNIVSIRICPDLFYFPELPILFNHVQFVYSNKPSFISSKNFILPEYICFNGVLCPFLHSFWLNNNFTSCSLFSDLPISIHRIFSWYELLNRLTKLFRTCSNSLNENNQILYQCNASSKTISKHRLRDGIQDCFYNDDERYLHSCMLPKSKHRFSCFNHCMSPIILQDHIFDCADLQDEESFLTIRIRTRILFQTICDGFVELDPPIMINGINHTDETECDLWLCNNIYTRCDGIWNCRNGEDEVNCWFSLCSALSHPCISIVNYSFLCLPMNKAGDGVVDCLGASDERHLCRTMAYDEPEDRFWCRGNTKCIDTDFLCNEKSQCDQNDDEIYCEGQIIPCSFFDIKNKDNKTFLCDLNDIKKSKYISFRLQNLYFYPYDLQPMNENVQKSNQIQFKSTIEKNTAVDFDELWIRWIWFCHRGIPVLIGNQSITTKSGCLCPSSYYGDRCQYQNQRVSITMQVKASFWWKTIIKFVFLLIDDDEHTINSHYENIHVTTDICQLKYNINLLYMTRPKNLSKNYSVQIDVYDGRTLEYHTSWLFPIKFTFLPVYRMVLQLIIPIESIKSCSFDCGIHGHCLQYHNVEKSFCRCNSGWSGVKCQYKHVCDCSSDSLCIGPSICLCPLNKFGRRCYLNSYLCQPNPCKNNGTCTWLSEASSTTNIICVCSDSFSGDLCQFNTNRIEITFPRITIQSSIIFIHFIKLLDEEALNRTTSMKKIGIYDRSVTIYRASSFHVAFVQINNNYYLIVRQEVSVSSINLSIDINMFPRCLSIEELFNKTFTQLHLIRRIKYYHLPCQKRKELVCFYDDSQMCFCDQDQRANCFEFDHNQTYTCRDTTYCQHGVECFQDDAYCPRSAICMCSDCYYGSRCQFSTIGTSLSLDIIIGYHILANISLWNQPLVTKISITINMIMTVFGILDSCLAIITFRRKHILNIGCGMYLFTSAIASLIISIIFTLKLWILILIQMNILTNRLFLRIQCQSIDYLLRIFASSIDWFNVSAAVDRLMTVIQGHLFDKLKSKRTSKYVIVFIILFTTSTAIQDLFHRDLIEDQQEERFWCLIIYSSTVQFWNSIVIYFHSLGPFIINIISALTIIILSARRRSKIQEQLTYKQHIRQQIQQHKHLLISSIIIMFLSLPRLIISSFSTCMKSPRDPWLSLVGYFISYIPSMLTFVVFVLPSDSYMKEFKIALKFRRVNCCL